MAVSCAKIDPPPPERSERLKDKAKRASHNKNITPPIFHTKHPLPPPTPQNVWYSIRMSTSLIPTFNNAQHDANLKEARVYTEKFLLTKFPAMLQTLYANAMPHDILYVREYDGNGRYQFERRVIDPVEMQHIMENKPREHWRLEQYGANTELLMQLMERVLGKPKQSVDIKTETSISIEAKQQADSVLDAYLNSKPARVITMDSEQTR